MGNSKIEWTEKTWNPIVGCSIVSPGCHHCYAAKMAARLRAMALADIAAGKNPGRKRHYIDVVTDDGRWTGKLAEVPEALADPLGWKKPTTIFVNSMSDLFHESVSDEFIDRVLAAMYEAQWHTYQILTKRIERAAAYLSQHDLPIRLARAAHRALRERSPEKADVVTPADIFEDIGFAWPFPNVLIGPSIEDQKRLDERMPHAEALADLGWHVMLSCEPLLGPLSFEAVALRKMRWVIVGGESGAGSREYNLHWGRIILQQCAAVDVAAFHKQAGANVVDERTLPPRTITKEVMGSRMTFKVGAQEERTELRFKDRKGGDPAEWPAELRVRQYPDLTRSASR